MARAAELTNGTYALSWRVVSEGDHPVGGSLVFSIGSPSSVGPEIGEQADPNVRLLIRGQSLVPDAGGEAGDTFATGMMARVIAIELMALVAVFGIAALWRFTPPPRAIAMAQSQPASVHIHTLQAMVDLTITPDRAGPVSVEIVLMNGEFGPLPAKELSLSFSNPVAGIEPIERQARLEADGIWRLDALNLPVPGRWEVELAILISDFEMRRIKDAVLICRVVAEGELRATERLNALRERQASISWRRRGRQIGECRRANGAACPRGRR